MNDLIYLAQPIDLAQPERALDVARFTATLTQTSLDRGIALYSPAMAWTLDPNKVHNPELVEEVNGLALALSGRVVAMVYPGMRSFGVPLEIGSEVNRKIPVDVVNVASDAYKPGVSLSALIQRGRVRFYQTTESFFKELESGE